MGKSSATKKGGNGKPAANGKKSVSATEKAKQKWGHAEVHNGGKEDSAAKKQERKESAQQRDAPQLYSVNGPSYYRPSPDQRQYKPSVIRQGRRMRFKYDSNPAGYSTARLKAQTAKALALALQRKLAGNKPTIDNFYAYKRADLSDSQRDYLRSVLKAKGYTDKEIPSTDGGLVERVRSVINGDILRYEGPYHDDITDKLSPTGEENVVKRACQWVKDFALLEYYNLIWSKKKTAAFNQQTIDRNPSEVVVVGHGLWQNAGGMYLAAQHLRKQGFDVVLLDYSPNTRWPWKEFGPKFLQSDDINSGTARQAVASLEAVIKQIPNVKVVHSLMHSDGENVLASLYKDSGNYIKHMLERGMHVIPGGAQKCNYTGLKPVHTVGVVGGKDVLVGTDVKDPRADDYFVVVKGVGHLYEVTGRHGSFDVYTNLLGSTHLYGYPASSNSIKGSSGAIARTMRERASPDYAKVPHIDRSLFTRNYHTDEVGLRKAA